MLQPPTHERTLAEMWESAVERSAPLGTPPEELENARVCFMQGALAAMWLMTTLAPAPASMESILNAVAKIHAECMKFVAQRQQSH